MAKNILDLMERFQIFANKSSLGNYKRRASPPLSTHQKPKLLCSLLSSSLSNFSILQVFLSSSAILAIVLREFRNFVVRSFRVLEFIAIQFVEWRYWCFTCYSSSLYPGKLTLAKKSSSIPVEGANQF